MNWKAIFGVIIIFAIVALILFSPKGQKYHGNYTSKYTTPVGNFLKGITGKITKTKATTTDTSQSIGALEVELKEIDISSLSDIEIPVNSDIEFSIDYEVINFLGTDVQVEDPTANIEMTNLVGTLSLFNSGRMKVLGKADSIKINDLLFEKSATDVLVVGRPVSLTLSNINQKKIIFNQISGSLKWSGLKGNPVLLKNDYLELINFKGDIIIEDSMASISGTLDSIMLNGVEISSA